MITSASTTVAMAAVIAAAMSVSCGSRTPTSPTGDSGSHTVIATVMIESTGLNPSEITIGVGETVSFMNHENVSYTVAGGASPSQAACPEINIVGLLRPGEIRATDRFSAAKTCDYHIRSGQTILFSGRVVVR